MQAHPQSSPAARIQVPPHQATSTPQPRLRVLKTAAAAPLTNPPIALADSAGLAHDAGNLLAALGLYCDLLSAPGVLRPEHRHYATELNLISNRSSELIRGLIAILHPTPQQPAEPAPGPILSPRAAHSAEVTAPGHAHMLRSLAPVLQQIAGHAARVSVICPASLPPIDVPPENMERIVVNLVRNAAQAIHSQRSSAISHTIPHSSEIRVALAIVAGRLQLTVEDTGPGMPPSAIAAFLQPTPLPPGATRGLGHRIVHELVHSSGGQLSIRVRPGNGTVLCIKWPLPRNTYAQQSRFDSPATLASRTFDSKPFDSKPFSSKPNSEGQTSC